MYGKLYIVATPIGNLTDISQRALETLKNVNLIFAEDTRVTQKLLSRYDIETKVFSYHHHSSENKKFEILARLQKGESIALVTDAGTPGVSDPGNELLDLLYDLGVDVQITPIPGPSSLSAALSICGFNTSKFIFAGFFPKKKANKWLNTYFTQDITTIYFDSPHRLIKNLEKIKDQIGDRRVFVARELTKLHEETFRGPVSEVLEELKASNPKGEVVVVVEA